MGIRKSTRMAKNSRKAASGRQANRRHPMVTVALLLVGLVTTGGAYTLFTSAASAQTPAASSPTTAEEGGKLFAANCATCHGLAGAGTKDGPSLYGVGAAAVDFQVGTGRMPLAQQGAQAEQKPVQFTQDQIDALGAWVAALAPGPGVPDLKYLKANGDVANGGELFRINCAMCHNVSGAGGALTQGKFAPSLSGVLPKHVYEAMVTGPQNMPVFNDANLTPQQKANIITYLQFLDKNPSPGGIDLGNLGPVSEGLFIWIFGLGAVVGVTIWIAARAN
jgi:ubiquinol-cytochrome c reductase cytochrome c subunit